MPCLRLACVALLAVLSMQAQGRTLQARIAKVSTPVATLEQVRVRLDWPADATEGELMLQAAAVDAADLGYRWRHVSWHCPLQRTGPDSWRCDGVLRSGRSKALRLALDLGAASSDAVLSDGPARFAVRRSAATPDLTTLDLTRVPIVWLQALLAQAWSEGQLKAGTLDGRLSVETSTGRPLRIAGALTARAVALETADATIAAEHLGGRFDIDYRKTPLLTLLAVDGELRGGEFLAGSTYVALPDSPVGLRIDGMQRPGQGWQLPTIAWSDGDALVAEGSAAFGPDARLRELDIRARSANLEPVRQRYLSGQLALFGLGEVALDGAADLHLQVQDGRLARADLALHAVDLRDPNDRFGFGNLEGDVRYASNGQVDSELAWQGGKLYGLDFGAARLPLRSNDGILVFREPVVLPMMGGRLRFEDVSLRPPAGGEGLDLRFALDIDGVDFGQVSKAIGLPAFQGTLSGRIPQARYARERLDFDGGLSMRLFDGTVEFTSLALERPFGTAPSLNADIAFEDLDLLRLTEVLDLGSITGRLDGRMDELRLVDWTPVAFDAQFRSDAAAAKRERVKQRISQRAVQNISSVGDASFVSSLQGRLIGLFDDFGYARIGIGCRLANEVCRMSGLDGDPGQGSVRAGSEQDGFTIVAGAGLPRLNVVGYNRDVDWPTLVERIAAVGKGDVKPVVE